MENEHLRAKYGILTAICMVVGIVIGSGVFFKASKVMLENNGNILLSLLTVAVVGIAALSCAYVFSLLARRISHVNGAVDYAEATCGSAYAYALGWFMSAIYYPCIASTLAWVAASYSTILLGLSDRSNLRFALAALYTVLAYFINAIAPRLAGRLQVSCTVIKLIPIGIMAVAGTLAGLLSGQMLDGLVSGTAEGLTGGSGFLGAVVAFAFAYEGWIIATTINAEIHDPRKNLPRALIIGISITVAAYLGYFIGVAGVLSPEEILGAGDRLPMLAFTALFGGNRAFGIIAYVFIIISCLGTLNGVMLGCCRGIYSIAERGQGPAPQLFSRVDSATNIPNNSAVFALLVTVLWLTQWEFGFIEQALPEWLSFENDELPIITLYLAYIPIFIVFMVKERGLHPVERFLVIPAGIISCAFMVFCAVWAYRLQSLYYLAVFALIMTFGMLFYRPNGRSLFALLGKRQATDRGQRG